MFKVLVGHANHRVCVSLYSYSGRVMRSLVAGDRVIVVAACGCGGRYSGVRVALTHAMRGHGAMSLGGCRLSEEYFVVFESWAFTYVKRGK